MRIKSKNVLWLSVSVVIFIQRRVYSLGSATANLFFIANTYTTLSTRRRGRNPISLFRGDVVDRTSGCNL